MNPREKSTLEPIGAASALVAGFVSLLRGGNQVALKFTLISFAPLPSACGRMALGSTVLAAWGFLRGDRLLPMPGEWRRLLTLASIFTVQIAILHYGADLTSPAYAVVMMNTNPIWANIFSHFFVPGDRLSARRVVALATAFGGVLLVFWAQTSNELAPHPTLGNAMLLLSAAMVAARTVYLQRLVQTIAPSRAALWQMFLSVPVYAAGSLFLSRPIRFPLDWQSVAGMLYQGVLVAGLCFPLWAHLLRRHSPAKLTTFNFIVPFVGLLWTAALFGERIGPRLLAGLFFVSLGIFVAAREKQLPPSLPAG